MPDPARPGWLHSLYGRISALYLLLSLALVLGCGWLTVQQMRVFVNEVDQKLHRPFAMKLAQQEAERLAAGQYADAVAHAHEQTTMFFPALELYVLDADGRVLAAHAPEGAPPSAEVVDLAPVHALLDEDALLPVWGDDPRQPGTPKVFSAAPAELAGGRPGYLYVILRGQATGSAEGMLQNSYLLRALPLYLLLALGASVVVGLVLFALLTRRFRRLTATVLRFKEGDFGGRVDARGRDEIGRLGRAFNEMADTIEAQLAALRQTDAERRKLVANISHDFRTPLTSIRGHAERLQARADQLPAETRRRYLDAILKNADRLGHLSEHLRQLSKIDARSLEPFPEAFSMAELVQDVLLKLHPQAEQWDVRLHAALDADLPPVYADIGLTERLLTNLLQNALENTPRGGLIEVQLRPEGDRVRVVVRDTGQGIPAEDLPLVHQRFYRARRPAVHRDNGSGLGLSIASEIAALHGGTLRLDSTEGEGTVVDFDLPVAG